MYSIYRIRAKEHNNDEDTYYGSTKQILRCRFALHKNKYKNYIKGKYHFISVFKIFDKYGIDNCCIELVQDNILEDDILKVEGEYIKNYNCVNIKIVSGLDKKEWHKQYYNNNKQFLLEKSKEKYICECGTICRIYSKQKHFRTLKHQSFLSSNNI